MLLSTVRHPNINEIIENTQLNTLFSFSTKLAICLGYYTNK